ncbi:hypothetical protein QQP08_013043 [Theobroma cacao]|nr:hypothetical protein QQP08_013043 [Theobroma cacao]
MYLYFYLAVLRRCNMGRRRCFLMHSSTLGVEMFQWIIYVLLLLDKKNLVWFFHVRDFNALETGKCLFCVFCSFKKHIQYSTPLHLVSVFL